MYTADQRSGSMHGKSFVLDSVYAGIDEINVYGRLDFAGGVPDSPFELVVNLESWPPESQRARRALRLEVEVEGRMIQRWRIFSVEEERPLASSEEVPSGPEAKLVIQRNFEFKLPLAWLLASPVSSKLAQKPGSPVVSRLRLRFSLWQNKLPIDALPLEGWIELQLLSENELTALAY